MLINHTRQLAAAFAEAVTKSTGSEESWIARNGEVGLFKALKKILPEVIAFFCLFISTSATSHHFQTDVLADCSARSTWPSISNEGQNIRTRVQQNLAELLWLYLC